MGVGGLVVELIFQVLDLFVDFEQSILDDVLRLHKCMAHLLHCDLAASLGTLLPDLSKDLEVKGLVLLLEHEGVEQLLQLRFADVGGRSEAFPREHATHLVRVIHYSLIILL